MKAVSTKRVKETLRILTAAHDDIASLADYELRERAAWIAHIRMLGRYDEGQFSAVRRGPKK